MIFNHNKQCDNRRIEKSFSITGSIKRVIMRTSILMLLLLMQVPMAGPMDSNWVQLFNGQDLDDWIFHFRGSEFNTIPKNAVFVEDGILKSEQSPYPFGETSFGHFSYRDEIFSHYLLRIEYMFINQAATGRDHWNFNNSGVMVHSQTMESMGDGQAFPSSLEAQFLGDLNCQNNPEEEYCCLDGGNDPCRDASHEGSVSQIGEGITMNLCTPGTYVTYNGQETGAHCITAQHATVLDNEWVEVSLHVYGDALVEFYVGDSKVFEFTFS